ncbi:MAG: adenylyltransferase/cytidyltransferase family protein [Candidatus Thermoplasmatota archaeon]|nr:adenylyltransferase/cytidyltransferase family protein [Candidatus Thermoplasmatota archaeon]
MTDLPLEPEPPESEPDSGVVVLGRFQPFHLGHEYMLESAAKWRNENNPTAILIIAIGSSNRPQNLLNPWTYKERSQMIETWVESNSIENYLICSIPDIEDPPNWVAHASRYHGQAGVLVTTDMGTAELYTASGWDVTLLPIEQRERFEGWRVRETARMLSTIGDLEAIREVLGTLIPMSVLDHLIETNGLHRLAFMGEGGEPVG